MLLAFFSLKRALKRKLLILTYLALLVIYLTLYCAVPFYIMPSVDQTKRKQLNELVSQIVKGFSNTTEKARKIYDWITSPSRFSNVYRNYKIDNYIVFLSKPPFICLRSLGEDRPLWFLFSRCGACMEYSLLYRELTSAANLTVRSVHNPGEDHNWDEVLVDGKWIIVDPGWPVFNPSPTFYEVKRHVNVSYVYARYPNGSIVDVTDRYTNTSLIRIRVTYPNGKPVENASLEFYSLNLGEPRLLKHLSPCTNASGSCSVKLGGGLYKLKVIKMEGLFGYSEEIEFEVEEGKPESLTLILQKDIFHLALSSEAISIISQVALPMFGFVWLACLMILPQAIIELLQIDQNPKTKFRTRL